MPPSELPVSPLTETGNWPAMEWFLPFVFHEGKVRAISKRLQLLKSIKKAAF